MKFALLIAAVFVALLAAGGGYIAWSKHKTDQAVQISYTPLKDNGPAIANPFSDISTPKESNSHE
jgi:hypothetical protein